MSGTSPAEDLRAWGWDSHLAAAFAEVEPGARAMPARVVAQERDRWAVRTATSIEAARLVGFSPVGGMPVVGDWVVVEPGPLPSDPLSLTAVLPRRSAISRGGAGTGSAEQVLAANIDVVWIVHGLDRPTNARRLERQLAAAWQSGAVPEIVLTKADLATDPDQLMAALQPVAIGVAVHLVSMNDPSSIERLKRTLRPGETLVLLGPSGVGKSTLVNLLADEPLAATGDVRASDHKGRHTTTRRELFRMQDGALLIDTPGLREFRIWALDEGLDQAFPEIDALASACRFRDCSHESEPGCAVLAAAEAGALSPERLASYRKLKAEAAWMDRKHDAAAQAAAVAKHKTALKTMKYHDKRRRQG